MQTYNNGVVVGRFQPFHNGHLEYVRKALDRCNHLYIGITTPGEKPTKYEPNDPKRYGSQNNPFSYDERKEMVRLALTDEQIDQNRYTILHFDPNRADLWFQEIPSDAVYILLLLSEEERQKVKDMQAHGLTVDVLHTITNQFPAGHDIRDRIMHSLPWEPLVPKSVAVYIHNLDIETRLHTKA